MPLKRSQVLIGISTVAVIAVAIVAGIWFTYRGSVAEALRLPPKLDPSTPAR